MTGLYSDTRHAIRALARSPGFSTLAVLMLALGIGVNTALFSMVDAVLLRALPFGEPDRLVEVFGRDATHGSLRVHDRNRPFGCRTGSRDRWRCGQYAFEWHDD